MDAVSQISYLLDRRERKQRLRELQVALEAAEYAAARLVQLDPREAQRWRVWEARYCDERSLVISEGER